jgi:hypothetical protein
MLKLGEQPKLRWALVAGAAWGFGILARPLPGVPFLVAAFVAFVFGASRVQWREQWKRKVGLLAAATVPVLAFGGVLLWVNWVQNGDPFKSGYQAFHGSLGLAMPQEADGRIAVSVGGALLRQNFWLFGWPLSLLFVPFARGRRSLLLFWGLIVAEYFYRVIAPKTVVSTTGPIYVTEIVPLLALATASGMVQVSRWLRAHGVAEGKRWVTATVLASFVVAATMFLPVQMKNIHRSCAAWTEPYRLLEKVGAKRALVFSMHMVPFFKSWAYYPPNPSPTLDEDVIFVRPPSRPNQIQKAVDFWQRRFPDRRAFSLYHEGDKAIMAELKRPKNGWQKKAPPRMDQPGKRPPEMVHPKIEQPENGRPNMGLEKPPELERPPEKGAGK